MNSVLQYWVMELPLRAQGTLLTGIRGCDLSPKIDLKSTERQLVGYLRFCVLNPADPREVGIEGAFFQRVAPIDWKASEFGHYPQHWYSHIMHCFEVVGYFHPDQELNLEARQIYHKFARNLHLWPETKLEMITRLTEDRFETGTVVS
jgi:hypothetical protein